MCANDAAFRLAVAQLEVNMYTVRSCLLYTALEMKVGWKYVYLRFQSVPRSKHTPSQLYKPVN